MISFMGCALLLLKKEIVLFIELMYCIVSGCKNQKWPAPLEVAEQRSNKRTEHFISKVMFLRLKVKK